MSASVGNFDQTVTIMPNAIVCREQTTIKGDVVIGSRTIIQPTVTIIAEKGPIIIGESNLIEEYVTIINKTDQPMVIGNNNVFEVGSHSESLEIQDNNVLEYKCRIGPKVKLTNGCVIGTMCDFNDDLTLPENTVVYGPDCKMRKQLERPALQTFQLDFLSKIMPNYQRIEKPRKGVKNDEK
ncbi:dynactin subunit 6 [Tetranychus urticae]|uniref:Dynactin subunit 6 n=1 Tax=Tetranychus urticae TaxID=32264 RepID=T1K3V2_TETUR|nr:dynactin subunit 6 [Tetranychus urticae]